MGREQFRNEGGRGTKTVGSAETPKKEILESESSRSSSLVESRAAAEKISEELQINERLAAADEAMATPPPRSAEEAEEINKKVAALESLEKQKRERLADINQSRIERVERVEKRGAPELSELSEEEYEKLARVYVGDKLVEEFQNAQEKLSAMQKMQKERAERQDAQFFQRMEELATAVSRIRAFINHTVLVAKTEQWERRIAEVKGKVDEHYKNRSAVLEGLIAELRADPEVAKRHQELIDKRKKQAEEEKLKAQQAFLEEITLRVNLLSQQQNAVLKRVEQIAGASTLSNPKETRQKIIAAILDGKGGGQIKSAEEILPWKRMDTERYYDSLYFLNDFKRRASLKTMADGGDKEAGAILEQLKTVSKTHDRFRDIADDKFWAAFNKRAQSERAETEKRLEEERKQREVQKEKAEAEIRAVVERGGFRVEVPDAVVKKAGKEGGGGSGAVRVEAMSERGKPSIKIVEVAGAAAKVFWKGAEYAASGGTEVYAPKFPSWAQQYITNNGKLAAKLEELKKQPLSKAA